MSFAEQLKRARMAQGLTQQQVADLMGITNSTYCGYETGKRQPDVAKIKQLAKLLNTPGDVLLETGFKTKEEPNSNLLYNEQEKEVIKKYRALDEHGTKVVDLVLDAEYTRCTDPQQDDDDLFVAPLVARSGERRNIVISKKELESLVPSDEEDL